MKTVSWILVGLVLSYAPQRLSSFVVPSGGEVPCTGTQNTHECVPVTQTGGCSPISEYATDQNVLPLYIPTVEGNPPEYIISYYPVGCEGEAVRPTPLGCEKPGPETPPQPLRFRAEDYQGGIIEDFHIDTFVSVNCRRMHSNLWGYGDSWRVFDDLAAPWSAESREVLIGTYGQNERVVENVNVTYSTISEIERIYTNGVAMTAIDFKAVREARTAKFKKSSSFVPITIVVMLVLGGIGWFGWSRWR